MATSSRTIFGPASSLEVWGDQYALLPRQLLSMDAASKSFDEVVQMAFSEEMAMEAQSSQGPIALTCRLQSNNKQEEQWQQEEQQQEQSHDSR